MKNKITRAFGSLRLGAKEHSPEILMVTGVIGVVVTVVAACKATLKFQDILEEHNENMDKLKELEEKVNSGEVPEERYSLKDAKDDRIALYVKLLVNAIKCYGPAVLMGAASVTSFGAATGIMKKRYISMASAYMLLQKDKEHLETRVIEEYGEEKLAELKRASNDERTVVEEVDEDGNVKTRIDEPVYDAYSVFFDESNPNFEKDPASNRIFLQTKQNWANHLLTTRGYLFLNEVHEMIGAEKTQAGQIMGWKYYKDPAKAQAAGASNCVSFGIFDSNISDKATQRFLNGSENVARLVFNVDKTPILGNIGLARA